MRVYIPATATVLRRWLSAAAVGPPPVDACAVTPALREWYVGGDSEDLEYAALTAAARRSLDLLGADLAAPRRRVVVAADVPDAAVEWAGDVVGDPARVRVTAEIPVRDIVSAHVDDDEAVPAVTAAGRALAEGSEDCDELAGDAEGYELAWYAVQELDGLLAGLG